MNEKHYKTIKSRYVTEKARVLEGLATATANKSLKACEKPKYVFVVDKKATKQEIAVAVEEIYADKKVKVKSVNTISIKPKKRRFRGRIGVKPGYKKAVVTLDKGDTLDEVV